LEIIEDGVSGVLVPPGDPEILAGVLADLLANPAKARALAEAGCSEALQRFSLWNMLEGVAQQIGQVVTQGRC
jgi:starch synthase